MHARPGKKTHMHTHNQPLNVSADKRFSNLLTDFKLHTPFCVAPPTSAQILHVESFRQHLESLDIKLTQELVSEVTG